MCWKHQTGSDSGHRLTLRATDQMRSRAEVANVGIPQNYRDLDLTGYVQN
jgi:hypothetical protein